jgi:hypothetical protein
MGDGMNLEESLTLTGVLEDEHVGEERNEKGGEGIGSRQAAARNHKMEKLGCWEMRACNLALGASARLFTCADTLAFQALSRFWVHHSMFLSRSGHEGFLPTPQEAMAAERHTFAQPGPLLHPERDLPMRG